MTIMSRTGFAFAALLTAGLSGVVLAQSYPRTLIATADVAGPTGSAKAEFKIQIERLMLDVDFNRVAEALKFGGYPKFLPALRDLPPVGYVQVGERQTVLKYARMRRDGQPRLVLGTDRPIFFVGGGAPDAKPKAGYEVGVIELEVDAQGNGQGTMAAAARVRPGPDGGVVIDDYATSPIRLSIKPAP
jgi:hypothetical protein